MSVCFLPGEARAHTVAAKGDECQVVASGKGIAKRKPKSFFLVSVTGKTYGDKCGFGFADRPEKDSR